MRATTVEVLELIPSAVQTDPMPGQAEHPCTTPLADFTAETMAESQHQPTPPEIKVQRLGFLLDAVSEGRFETTSAALNGSPA